jgi:hypothetical protein
MHQWAGNREGGVYVRDGGVLYFASYHKVQHKVCHTLLPKTKYDINYVFLKCNVDIFFLAVSLIGKPVKYYNG